MKATCTESIGCVGALNAYVRIVCLGHLCESLPGLDVCRVCACILSAMVSGTAWCDVSCPLVLCAISLFVSTCCTGRCHTVQRLLPPCICTTAAKHSL